MQDHSIAYFWDRVVRSECWEWQGPLTRKGYPNATIEGKSRQGHRFSWQLAGGVLVPKMVVCHTCDNRRCVRNDDRGQYVVEGVAYERRGHLWLGTVAANNADRRAKGRYGVKLSDEQIAEIIAFVRGGGMQKEAAALYGIHPSYVSHIMAGHYRSPLALLDAPRIL